MKTYELLLTLPGTLDENEVQQELDNVVNVVKEFVKDVKINRLGKVRLAYPIKLIRYGYFYTIIFDSETVNIPKINKKLALNKLPLRAMICIHNPKSADVQIVLGTTQPKKTEVKEKVSLKDVMEAKEPKKEEPTPVVVAESSKEEKPAVEEATTSKGKVDLSDIDKKLDEILDSTEMA